MKAALVLLVSVLATSAIAAPVQLNCRRIDPVDKRTEKLFDRLKLKMELPDVNGSAPGDLVKQKIQVTFKEMDRMVTKTASFINRAGSLSATLLYGADFGAGNFNLYWDYDAKEIVAVIVTSSDGPMNVEVQRCSAK